MKSRILYGALILCIVPFAEANSDSKRPQLYVGKYMFPALLSQALVQGLTVPVYLKFDEDTQIENTKSKQKIADAQIVYKNGQLFIEKILFEDVVQTTELSPAVKNEMATLKQAFDNEMKLKVTDNAYLQFDLQSLYLELNINKNALGTKFISRTDVLGESTSKNITSVLNYRFGASYNDFDGRNTSSSYLSLDNVTSLREHHLLLNGSVYGLGESETRSEIYRALYERDFEGNRLAVGMMDTWGMQSIASLNALNTSKVYGATYGNKSSTIIQDKSQSLVPILVFLPSAGTVQLYRDGRLLSIQNFSMGSHEVDTSGLPYGLYNIEVKILINGQETSSTIAQVNKSLGRNSSVTGVLDWQVFGGMLEYIGRQNDYAFQPRTEKETWLAGIAVAKNFAVLSGVGLRSTLYAFDENAVAEVETNITFPSNTTLNIQSMLTTDSSYRASVALNYNLPKGYGSIWGARNISEVGNKLSFIETDTYDLGVSLNLKQLHKKLGFVSASYSDDLKRSNSTMNIEYTQNLFNNRYADIGFRAGLQQSKFNDQKDFDDKYIYFDVRLPISKWFSAGISSRNSNLQANASYKQSFNDSVITNVGVDFSQIIDRKNNDFNTDRFMASGYVGYETKYNAGTLSASGSTNSYALNYTSQGTVATTGKDIVFGNNSLNSGIVIETGLKDKGKMSALINGQDFTLSGKKNFISLSPYQKYTVELRNDKNSVDSVSIGQGRKSTVVLYPGNVSVIQPEIKQMVTIFGRVYYPNGEVAANSNIHNHIGKTVTDKNGEFSLDIDKRYPMLTLVESNGDICESKLDLSEVRGAAWLGDIHCTYKPTNSNKTGLEVRNRD
ncbi:CS1-pili formation C-terminal domain-containing protein [Acinetobacter baumannii]|nr:CS1-pili formation C-terminal domain-containing protein [Acinetobacter baumannii]MDV7527672.1 CS1-pili formation C-terminal domain-containing protein [Acinetobacter baumannii]